MSKMGQYTEDFPIGSVVRIADLVELRKFSCNWKYHHPLQDNQFDFAGKLATVTNVMFYHGGDVLYQLSEIPGIWHEVCLRLEENSPS